MYTKEMVAVLPVQRNAPGLLLLMSVSIYQSDILSAETVRQWGCCRGGVMVLESRRETYWPTWPKPGLLVVLQGGQ
jgi:hypothetical protein